MFKDGRAQLIADEGKIITNGIDVYGYDITLAVGADSSAFHEISVSEYEAKIASEMSESDCR
jgi:hypothetical protein